MTIPADATGCGDLAPVARARLTPGVWDFLEGGSGREQALGRNSDVLRRLAVVPRVCSGAGTPTTTLTLMGSDLSAPIVVAPMAYHGLIHEEAELATARSADLCRVAFTAPMMSTLSLRDTVRFAGTTWYQAYWLRDRRQFDHAVSDACEAGCTAVVLTVDMPRMARRCRDLRNRFAITSEGRAHAAPSAVGVAVSTNQRFSPDLTWKDVAEVSRNLPVPLILKGILHPEDAQRAFEAGAAAVVVSNHGGRQSPTAPAALEVLPAIRARLGPEAQLLVDGCMTSGDDILVALASGANAVMVGRAVMWGLAAAGSRGVSWVLTTLRDELLTALCLAGCRTLADVSALEVVSL